MTISTPLITCPGFMSSEKSNLQLEPSAEAIIKASQKDKRDKMLMSIACWSKERFLPALIDILSAPGHSF